MDEVNKACSCINDEVQYNIPSTVIFFLGILHRDLPDH